jgi:HNH endonuclease
MVFFRQSYDEIVLHYASGIQSEIYGDEHLLLEFDSSFFDDEFVLKTTFKPNIPSLLHAYIDRSLVLNAQEFLSECGEDVRDKITQELGFFNISLRSMNSFSDEDSYDCYLSEVYCANVPMKLTPDIFEVLFQRRTIMKKFNETIASQIQRLSYERWKEYLKTDGVMLRCTYWPQNLKRALFRREQGHCAMCPQDLRNLMANDEGYHIDHIIPIKQGGSNDLTNLQLVCSGCNQSKGGDGTDTSSKYSPFFK